MPGTRSFLFSFSLILAALALQLNSCNTIDLYEKNVAIPGHQWQSSFKPRFQFNIKDTTVPYHLFIVLRHNEKYNYNNIWVKLSIQPPSDTTHTEQLELTLANNEKGWLGTSMDDLYEHRVRVTPPNGFMLKKGDYSFTIQQIMRDDPLENVMNVGLRIEKKTQ
ncbi:MAG TPA: gliding motility lipoprotein GldH [Flavisolibacter sp.]